MCSMSPNSKDVWNLWIMWLSKTPFHWNPTWPTRPIPSKFSTNKTESRATRLLGSTRCNRMITLKMKPRGNMKTSCDPTTPSSSRQGNYATPLIFLASIAISGWDFLFRGESCNTLYYSSSNLSLITIISGLVMHDATGLINSEWSQRLFWFNLKLNHWIWTNKFLVWTFPYPWVGSDTRCNQQTLFHVSSKFKVSRRNYIKSEDVSDFSFEIHSESEEVSIERVVHQF
jgi:hypothetical protein